MTLQVDPLDLIVLELVSTLLVHLRRIYWLAHVLPSGSRHGRLINIVGRSFNILAFAGWGHGASCSPSQIWVVGLNDTKEELACQQRVRLVLITLVLSHQVEATCVIVQAHKWLHWEDEISQVEGMLYLATVLALDVYDVYKVLDVLFKAIEHYRELLVANVALFILVAVTFLSLQSKLVPDVILLCLRDFINA